MIKNLSKCDASLVHRFVDADVCESLMVVLQIAFKRPPSTDTIFEDYVPEPDLVCDVFSALLNGSSDTADRLLAGGVFPEIILNTLTGYDLFGDLTDCVSMKYTIICRAYATYYCHKGSQRSLLWYDNFTSCAIQCNLTFAR
jgi:hypothetical protein